MNAIEHRPPPFNVLIMSEESRLGREQIETSYAMKKIVSAGVRVFIYLTDSEGKLENPTDKLMMSLAAHMDEMEREKLRLRVFDGMVRRAKSGYWLSGSVFGYTRVPIYDASGNRVRTELKINEEEAAIVQKIFGLRAAGIGSKRITKELNAEGAPCPKPKGRHAGLGLPVVRAVLGRELYCGKLVWAKKDGTRPLGTQA